MNDVRAMFRDVRAHYRSTGEVKEGQACRNLMCTRVKDFDKRITGCVVRPSPLHGDGVFALRDIVKGELITFFPADALLVWEGGDRKLNDCFMLFGGHVPQEERDARAILDERVGGYELYVTGVFSAVGNPSLRDDPAYLGHLANDASTCLEPKRVDDYRREVAAAANAVPVWVEGCHLALQASKPIAEGEEVLYAYGEGWWLTRGGHEGVGANIRVVGSGMVQRTQSERLKSVLRNSRGGTPGPAKGASSRSSRRKASVRGKARKKGARDEEGPKKGFG
eukprot:CAMPEP_0183373938 /NCGR_PEP_ID=MMETSP0164_2-20130417/112912_1 /TAXON_ID=221442 /ORGANISM="Coccolithus pelagicus ssp braarudi, Strain PLY182g" /LENGTH=279 /DNA_ID=CAMNT_0025550889 /DNA_START=84 /DNA_END=923 /DNA_ORIENTATION=-